MTLTGHLNAEAETSTKNNSEVSASAQPQGSCKSDFLLQDGINSEFRFSKQAFLFTLNNLPKAKTILINIGINSLVHDTGLLNIRSFKNFIKDIAELVNSGTDRNIAIVVSDYLEEIKPRYLHDKNMPSKETGLYSALVAMVHNDIANLFCDGFSEYSLNAIGISPHTANTDNAKAFKTLESIAFSRSKTADEKIDAIKNLLNTRKTSYQTKRPSAVSVTDIPPGNYEVIKKTADTLRGLFRNFPRTIPIVMENVSHGGELGDEEFAARIAVAINADAFVTISRKGMLYTTDPGKNRRGKSPFYCYDTSRRSPFDADRQIGLSKKLNAAQYVNQHSKPIPMLLGSNNSPFAITKMFTENFSDNLPDFTLFVNSKNPKLPIEARHVSGKITIDSNAAKALVSGKGSLLLAGVTNIDGDFDKKSVVLIVDDNETEIGKGVVNCPSCDIKNLNKDFEIISREKMRMSL